MLSDIVIGDRSLLLVAIGKVEAVLGVLSDLQDLHTALNTVLFGFFLVLLCSSRLVLSVGTGTTSLVDIKFHLER